MENDKKKYLPIGTVVRPRDANIELMIVHRDTKSDLYDYVDYGVIIYPGGRHENGVVTINNETIAEILHLGYYDPNDYEYINDIRTIVAENNISTKNFKSQNEYPVPNQCLPIGTLFKTEDNNMYMVIDYVIVNKNNEIRDYLVCSYPDGNEYADFNQEDITEIISMGYINKKCYKYLRNMPKALDRIKREHKAGIIKPEKMR